MKFLENSSLEQISSTISVKATDCILDFKLESYSCKMVQSDKKQWKKNNGFLSDRQPLSPPEEWSLATSPLGHSHRMRHLSESCSGGSDNDGDEAGFLVDSISRRTLFDLIGLLNTAYSDYDFNDVKSNYFSRIPDFEMVIQAVDNKFRPVVAEYAAIREDLWKEIEEEIKPSECKIFSYNSNYDGDPFSEEGVIWCFNYFFYNKTLKRIMFLSCRAHNKRDLNMSAEEMWNMDE